MKSGWRRFTAHLTTYGIAAALVIEFVAFSLLSDRFLTVENFLNILRQNAAVAVIAAGMTCVILTGGIDLSVGAIVAVSGVACAALLKPEWGTVWLRATAGCALGLIAGAVAGAINGGIVTRMRIPPFVATLAMLSIARGATLHYTQSKTISGLPETFAGLGIGWPPIVVLGIVYLATWVMLRYTVFGRQVYAIGGSAEAARLCGVRVERVLLGVYMLSGLLAGLAGVMWAARMNAGYPNAGSLYELDAIAAVVVGGTSLMGGRGSIWGTLAGALVIATLNNGLNMLNVEYYSQKIVIGVVLVLAAFLDRFRSDRA